MFRIKISLLIKATLFYAIFLSGCSVTFSPPIQNYFIPIYPDSENVLSFGLELYNWPLARNGIKPYYDPVNDYFPTLLFYDTHSSAIIANAYTPFFYKRKFKLGFNQFLKVGVWRTGQFSKSNGLSKNYYAIAGGGIRLLPHIVTPHYMIGASIVLAAADIGTEVISRDTILKDLSIGYTLIPEMVGMAWIYAYYITGNNHAKFYIGPFSHMIPPTFSTGINNGIIFLKNGKETFRLSLSAVYYREYHYRLYNLFPAAFMISVWKTLKYVP